jgi:molecular chaperone GrpE (heat shock protein)
MKTAHLLFALTLCSANVFADMIPGPLPGKPYTMPLPDTEKETATVKPETEANANTSQAASKTDATPANDKAEKLETLVQQQAKTISELQEKVETLEKNLALEKEKAQKKK